MYRDSSPVGVPRLWGGNPDLSGSPVPFTIRLYGKLKYFHRAFSIANDMLTPFICILKKHKKDLFKQANIFF